jgi:Icc-related predicted phosphoesterase
MKILVISDIESKYYWDYYSADKLEDIDMIISCGDLDAKYLSFLVTLSHAPVFYVHGNHDEGYLFSPPDGCTCIDDKVIVHNGVRIMGLGGSMRYRPGFFQYTERQMKKRYHKLLHKILFKGGIDILVTHSPARNLNDGDDLPHRGFSIFNTIIQRHKPQYFLHGHVHQSYSHKFKRYDKLGDTTVVNGCERCIIELNNKGAV